MFLFYWTKASYFKIQRNWLMTWLSDNDTLLFLTEWSVAHQGQANSQLPTGKFPALLGLAV